MCGIAGILSLEGFEKSYLRLMSSALQHRGPDGYGYMLYSEGKGMRVVINDDLTKCVPDHDVVGFAHRRLSILDLSETSSQPMKNGSNTCCVVYNGELYNYLDLKKELQDLGFTFKTSGDTEVLLRSYEAWGPECVKKFNGMWAFLLLDVRDQSLIISRDRFGIKPLYYMIQDHKLFFASEIKGLLAIPGLKKKPNEKTMAKYLLTGLIDDTEETFFEGILQFPAGNWAKISLRENKLLIKPEPYWTIPIATYQKKEKEAIEEFRTLFLDALKIHTHSDVPVGTCLSGGLDSSAIVCASNQLRKRFQIPNYTHSAFGYCPFDEKYSEKKYMDMVIDATSVRMNRVNFTQDQFQNALPLIIQSQDEPFGSASIIAQWFVFQKAKENGMTVMLDGQGSDEMLAGYHTYFITIALDLLAKRKISSYLRLRSKYEKEIGEFPLPYRFLTLGAMVLLVSYPFSSLLPPAIRLYKRLKKSSPLTPERISLTHTLVEQYPIDQLTPKNLRSLNEELKIHLQSTSLPALLRYEDRNSMAHSIEARVPFLDYRLVELVFTLPDEFKIKGITTKYIFREAMKDILPEAIRTRKDKLGFKPDPDLTFTFVRNHIHSLLENETEYEQRWFNKKGVEKMLHSEDRSVSFEFLLWRILNTKLWIRQHWGRS